MHGITNLRARSEFRNSLHDSQEKIFCLPGTGLPGLVAAFWTLTLISRPHFRYSSTLAKPASSQVSPLALDQRLSQWWPCPNCQCLWSSFGGTKLCDGIRVSRNSKLENFVWVSSRAWLNRKGSRYKLRLYNLYWADGARWDCIWECIQRALKSHKQGALKRIVIDVIPCQRSRLTNCALKKRLPREQIDRDIVYSWLHRYFSNFWIAFNHCTLIAAQ